jgi:hypothetical protein
MAGFDRTFSERAAPAQPVATESAKDDDETSVWDKLDDPKDVDEVRAILKDAEPVKIAGETVPGVFRLQDNEGNKKIIEWDGKDKYVSVSDPAEYVYGGGSKLVDDLSGKLADQFSKDFSESPGKVYHATAEENVEGILKDGLEPRAQTRGMTNRSVGDAVYTTMNEDSARSGTYGDAVFEIDCAAMKRDKVLPAAEQEPAAFEYEARGAVANALGMDDFEQDGSGDGADDPDTVVLRGNIPAKYLKLIEGGVTKAMREAIAKTAAQWDGIAKTVDATGREHAPAGSPAGGEFTGKGGGKTAAQSLKEMETKLDAEHPGWRKEMFKLPRDKKWALVGLMGDKNREDWALKTPMEVSLHHNESEFKADLLVHLKAGTITEQQAQGMMDKYRAMKSEKLAADKAREVEEKAKQGEHISASHEAALSVAISRGFKPAETVEAANKTMNDMGVAGAFKRGQVGLANTTNAALYIAKQAGDPLPPKVEVVNRASSNWMALLSYVTYKEHTGKPPETVLQVNSSKAHQANWVNNAKTGWLSQANPVLHEIGHNLHLVNNPTNYITWHNTEKYVKIYSDEKKTAEKVSRYAATVPSEFIAETYAGIRSGKTYPDDVKNLYKKYCELEVPS